MSFETEPHLLDTLFFSQESNHKLVLSAFIELLAIVLNPDFYGLSFDIEFIRYLLENHVVIPSPVRK